MPSQANLIYGVAFNNLPEAMRARISGADDWYESEWSEFGLPGADEVKALGREVLERCRREGLLRFPNERPAEATLEFHCSIGEIDESEENGVFGIAITSRYTPTLADNDPHGGLWPIAFDERLRKIQEIFENAVREDLPAFQALDPIWVVKEDWY